MRLILIFSLLFSNLSHADSASSAAAAVLLVFGAAKASQYTLEQGIWPSELQDWKDPHTQITAEIVDQCNILIEGRLVGNNRINALMLILKNQQDEVKFNPQNIEFEFADGLIRRPDVASDEEQTFVKNTRYIIFIPFPRKSDFKNQNKLVATAKIQVGQTTCEAKLDFNRHKEVLPTPYTYTRMTSFEFEMHYGNSSFQGPIADIAQGGISTIRLDLNFLGQKHGMYIGYGGTSNFVAASKYIQAAGFTGTSPEAYLSGTYIGYLHRYILEERHFLIYKLGIGNFAFKIEDRADKNNRNSFGVTAFNQQLQYSYYFAQVERGFWAAEYAVSFGIDHQYIPSGSLGPYGFNGNQYALLLSLKMGD